MFRRFNIKRKAIEPLIATILLVVVSVILVTIVLTWGKEFTTSSLNKTNNFGDLKASDATSFVYPKSAQDGVVQFTYSPPSQITEDINITHYRIINIPEMTEPIALEEPTILTNTNILELPCLYEYSTTTPDLAIQLITTDNTFIDIKIKDAGMVCTPGGDGTEANPKIICTAEDLNNIRHTGYGISGQHFKLGKNIDLQCFSRRDINGWEPIGDGDIYFESGSFDGGNYTINNLYINRPITDYVGLFGYIDSSIIKNFNIIDFNITGQEYVGGLTGYSVNNNIYNISSQGITNAKQKTGGLIGYSTFDDISNCNSGGSVRVRNSNGYAGGLIGIFSEDQEGILIDSYSSAIVGSLNPGSNNMGGLIGYSSSERISGCYATGQVYGADYVGGLIGYSYMTYTIKNCFATGEITFNQVGGNSGGLVGYFDGGDITECYAIYSILEGSSGQNYIGGLVGHLVSGSISDCYSLGSISGADFIGGLIGANEGVGEINTSYAVVVVSGSSSIGGLLGYNENGAFTGSYWDTNVSEIVTSDGGEGKTTTEMKTQNTFTDWDFSTVWAIDSSTNSGYPYLRNNPPR